jgi:hypothetical protein
LAVSERMPKIKKKSPINDFKTKNDWMIRDKWKVTWHNPKQDVVRSSCITIDKQILESMQQTSNFNYIAHVEQTSNMII